MACDAYVFLMHSFCKLKYSWKNFFFNTTKLISAAYAKQLLPCGIVGTQLKGASTKLRPHYAVRQNVTHCCFATRQKLLDICRQFDRVHIKKEFFADYTSGYKNCGTRPVNFIWFFLFNWWMPFWNPLLIICHAANIWWDRYFVDWIFMPHGMLQHAEALPKSHRIDVHIILAICRTQGRILLHSAARHGVDAP